MTSAAEIAEAVLELKASTEAIAHEYATYRKYLKGGILNIDSIR
jgi:hypothetical protein